MNNTDFVSRIDHLVMGAVDLTSGQNYVQQIFGALPVIGGTHPTMGTHNCLLRIGPSSYLEIISINQDIEQPKRPHWFDLDKLLPNNEPKLLTWVVRTNNIQAVVSKSKISFGRIEKMKRGNLEWLITIRKNGSMPLHGICPTLIQWQTGGHPTDKLPESGCSLIRLESFHPKAKWIKNTLTSIGFQDKFIVEKGEEMVKPSLIAYFETPNGQKKITS